MVKIHTTIYTWSVTMIQTSVNTAISWRIRFLSALSLFALKQSELMDVEWTASRSDCLRWGGCSFLVVMCNVTMGDLSESCVWGLGVFIGFSMGHLNVTLPFIINTYYDLFLFSIHPGWHPGITAASFYFYFKKTGLVLGLFLAAY